MYISLLENSVEQEDSLYDFRKLATLVGWEFYVMIAKSLKNGRHRE